MCAVSALAQEKLFQSANVQSPVVNADGTVTFNIFAPKAVKVEVTGDFLPTQPIDIPGYGKYDAPGVAQLKEGNPATPVHEKSFESEPAQADLGKATDAGPGRR